MLNLKKILFLLIFILLCMVVPAERYYVKPDGNDLALGTSWNEGFASLLKAVQTVQASDEIWVACGTYQEGEEINLPTKVKLYGGFMGTETELSQREDATSITLIDGESTHRCIGNYGSSLIDGFHITNGYAESGAGIYNRSEVTNCVFYGNTAVQYGGGIYNDIGTVTSCTLFQNHCNSIGGGVVNGKSSGSVSGCIVYGNTAKNGAGIAIIEGTVTGCIVYKNIADSFGGGIINYFGGTITNCTVFRNEAQVGGGVYLQDGILSHCNIYLNKAHEGGGIYHSGITTINCAIYQNTADTGGGASVYNGVLRNSVLYQNEGTDKGGGIYFWDGTVTGCIIFNSINEDIDYTSGTLEYSCFGGALPTNGNIDEDPIFANPGDFHLQKDSPCIDAGNPDAAWNDACLPPGKETARNDMGVYGGPYNCDNLPDHMPEKKDYINYLLGKANNKILDLNDDRTVDIADLISLFFLK